MSLHVRCPGCQLILLVPPSVRARAVRCPGCRVAFQVRMGTVRPSIGSSTTRGKQREQNEDALVQLQMNWSVAGLEHTVALLAVIDGMGGHAAGDRASAIVAGSLTATLVPRLSDLVSASGPMPDANSLAESLDLALWDASRAIRRAAGNDSSLTGMGATAVAALIVDMAVSLCHVGDCRAYLIRNDVVSQITQDHTVAQRLSELGNWPETPHRQRSEVAQLTQALGWRSDVEPSRRTFSCQSSDILILASDGLHAHLDKAALVQLAATTQDAEGLARTLTMAADAKGGSDNCSALVVRWPCS